MSTSTFVPIGDRDLANRRLPAEFQIPGDRSRMPDVLISGGAISGSGTGVSLYVRTPSLNYRHPDWPYRLGVELQPEVFDMAEDEKSYLYRRGIYMVCKGITHKKFEVDIFFTRVPPVEAISLIEITPYQVYYDPKEDLLYENETADSFEGGQFLSNLYSLNEPEVVKTIEMYKKHSAGVIQNVLTYNDITPQYFPTKLYRNVMNHVSEPIEYPFPYGNMSFETFRKLLSKMIWSNNEYGKERGEPVIYALIGFLVVKTLGFDGETFTTVSLRESESLKRSMALIPDDNLARYISLATRFEEGDDLDPDVVDILAIGRAMSISLNDRDYEDEELTRYNPLYGSYMIEISTKKEKRRYEKRVKRKLKAEGTSEEEWGIVTMTFDEGNLPETCSDIIMLSDEKLGEYVNEDATDNIVLAFPSPDNTVSLLCFTKTNLRNALKNRNDNIFYECDGKVNVFGAKDINPIMNKPYLKFPVNASGLNGFVPRGDVARLLRSKEKVFYVVPKVDEENNQIMISHTVSHKNTSDDSDDHDRFVSSNHCQAGSSILLYTIKVCGGDGCIVSSALKGNK